MNRPDWQEWHYNVDFEAGEPLPLESGRQTHRRSLLSLEHHPS